MATSKKIIVVVGATGKQGSSVAHTYLSLPSWHVRCITRTPSSPASQNLSSLGAEVIQADLSDETSLHAAFADASVIFLNTDFWGPYIALKANGAAAYDTEVLHGTNAAKAAASIPSLSRLIFSTMAPAKKFSNGKYGSKSFHTNTKPAIAQYILEDQPELAKKTSFIYIGAYCDNAFLHPKFDQKSGKYIFVSPLPRDAKMPIINPTEATGPLVQALVEEQPGTHLLAYDSYMTMGEAAEAWSKASGKDAEYMHVSTTYLNENFGVPMEVLDVVEGLMEYGYMAGVEKYIEPGQLGRKVELKSYEDWLSARDWEEILVSMESGTAKPMMRSMEAKA